MLELDTQRGIVIEPPESLHRPAGCIKVPYNDPFGRVYQWATGSVTLKPVNIVPEFTSTSRYEALKFRLADCIYQDGAFTERPHGRDDDGPYDYFLLGQVQAPHLGKVGDDTHLVPLMYDVAIAAIDQVILTAYEAELRNHIPLIYSRDELPANQAYHIRFRIDGHGDESRSSAFRFYFAEYALQLDSNGLARLFRTSNMQHGWAVATFEWAKKGQIHGFDHEIIIRPGAREFIEFFAANLGKRFDQPVTARRGYREGDSLPNLVDAYSQSSYCFWVPYNTKQEDGTYKITEAGHWAVAFSREFLAEVQVSRLGYFDGTAVPAKVSEGRQTFGYAPTMPLDLSIWADLNGGTITAKLLACDDWYQALFAPAKHPIVPWVSNGKFDEFTFSAQLRGLGDIPAKGVAAMSSVSPEFYGYVVSKAARFDDDLDATPVSFPVVSLSIDCGSSPENETLQVVLDNAYGSLDPYAHRTHMPVRLYDAVSGVTLFEGWTHEIESSRSPATKPNQLRITARGMADAFLRSFPGSLDFTEDPSNPGYAYRWQSALKKLAARAGFSEGLVVFDGTGRGNGPSKPYQYSGSMYDFPLWREGGSGGASSGGVQASTGASGQRWRPNPLVPIYQFYDTLVRDVLGWHWGWDKVRRQWRHWKRPQPDDLSFADVKCAFFSDQASLLVWRAKTEENAAVPCYLHRELSEKTKGPECTTINAYGYFPVRIVQAREQMNQIIMERAQPDIDEAPAVTYGQQVTLHEIDNPRGYPKPGLPKPDRTNPDYMGKKLVRDVPLLQLVSEEAFRWVARRIAEDLLYGWIFAEFESDWGDLATHNLRKWDLILIDPDPEDVSSGWYLIDRVEPQSSHDAVRSARYTASKFRPDAHPPR